MYIDSVGRQVLTHGTKWDEIDFGKCSVQPADVGFCDICKTYLRHSALERHNQEQHSVGRDAKLCLSLLNDTIKVEEERLTRVTPTDFDLAYIKQLHERRANLEAKLAAVGAGVDPDYEAAWDVHTSDLAALDPAYEQYEIAREALAS